jgi:hypothetical protein
MLHTESIPTRKITAHLPVGLLEAAQQMTGAGVTETLRLALEEMKQRKIYEDFQKLRGTYTFSLDLNELRKDRDEP